MNVSDLSSATLKTADGQDVVAQSFWADRPCVVLVLRRPGCVLCRAEAKKLWERRADFGPANLVCVVHEWRDREIKAFVGEGYWPGPLYHDTSKTFYKFLGDGQLVQGTAMGLLNPFGAVWSRIREASKTVATHNVVGEGLIMGGLLVVGAGGSQVHFRHVEADLGLHADHQDAVRAVEKALAEQKGLGGVAAAAAERGHSPARVATVLAAP